MTHTMFAHRWLPAPMQHADLVKSATDPHTYLIHDTTDPLQASLSGLLLEGLPPAATAGFAARAGTSPCARQVVHRTG